MTRKDSIRLIGIMIQALDTEAKRKSIMPSRMRLAHQQIEALRYAVEEMHRLEGLEK